MATELFVRRFNGALISADGISSEAMEDLKHGTVYQIKLTASRKYKFLQKAFVLVSYAFSLWEPQGEENEYKGRPIEKNAERFREMLTILAGFYDPVYKIGGDVQLIAKSWSYSAMPDDEDFSKLYNGLINVILANILPDYTGEQLDDIVNNLLRGFG
ncbi:MAG: DUF1367 family protein [Methylobacter sp.]